jgi:uncharacterized protein
MIVYFDTSALAKRYLVEKYSDEVREVINKAQVIGMSVIGRVEMVSAIARSTNFGLNPIIADQIRITFEQDLSKIFLLSINKAIIDRAASLAWQYHLRGYDAVHLASALEWQTICGEKISFYSFDRKLWEAAMQMDLMVHPESV